MNAVLLVLLLGMLFMIIALAVFRFVPPPRSRTPADRFLGGAMSRDDERCWFGGGLFYNNPDDPAPVVPNRYLLGMTLNFGHPLARLLVVLIIALLLVPVVVAIAFQLPGSGCHSFGCSSHP